MARYRTDVDVTPLDPFIGEITGADHQHQRETTRRRYRASRHDLVATPAKQLYKFRGDERERGGRSDPEGGSARTGNVCAGSGEREGGEGRR